MNNLLKIRSHLVFFAGLLTAVLLVCSLESFELQPEEGSPQSMPSPAPAPSAPRRLSADDLEHARLAWRYFERNYQPETGLVNSVDGYPAASMWDTASSMVALSAARELSVVEPAVFDQRMAQLLETLAQLPLFEGRLPNKAYQTRTLQMVDYNNKPSRDGIGWSALDVGRMLVALHLVALQHPQHTQAVHRIVARWKLADAVRDGELVQAARKAGKTRLDQEGRLGYEQYAARGFLLWGLDAVEAARWDRWNSTVDVLGMKVPIDRRDPKTYTAQNFVVSEPYLMLGLEFGLSGPAEAAARQVLAVQEARFVREGILTACSESNLDQAPWFGYFCIYSGGESWVVVDHDGPIGNQYRSFHTSSGFGWHALFPGPYTEKLVEEARRLGDPEKGFYAGRYEADQRPNATWTANSNGLILESLLYRERGPLLHGNEQPPG